MTVELSDETRIVARKDVASCALGSGAALLDMREGVYYNVNAVAALIWDEIAAPMSIAEICGIVAGKFDVDEISCTRDVKSLAGELRRLGLIEIVDAQAA